MNTTTAGDVPRTVQPGTAAGDGAPPRAAPGYSTAEVVFMIATPLAWAVLLAFHGPGPSDDVYGSLRDEASRFLVVHIGSLLLLGLMGAALYLLVRDLPGRAAQVSRLAIAPFVLLYGAGEAIQGVATGVLVDHANDVAAGQRPAAGDAADALYDSFSGQFLIGAGAVAGIVALIAAAVAVRRVGAPTAASILLGLSALLVFHAPPTGPVALVFFAVAVWLVARARRSSARTELATTTHTATPVTGT
jgi:hypothetical protein